MNYYIPRFKKALTYLCFVLLFAFFALPCFAKDITITLNGNALPTTTAPILDEGTTLVPLRLISENLGSTVNYDGDTKEITITTDTGKLRLTLGSLAVSVNGTTSTLATAPRMIQGTTMVPLRFISENLNCKVEWLSTEQTVALTTSAIAESPLPIATIKVKGYGTITLELYPYLAPNTVNNFAYLANNKFYDGLIFHRIIENFMIQGGDPLGTGIGNPGYSIPGEFAANGYTLNTLSHTKGVISMARSSWPDTAGSQFFITSADATYLDGQYAAFGKVISGIELIEKLHVVATDTTDKPLENVVIETIRVSSGAYELTTPYTIPEA